MGLPRANRRCIRLLAIIMAATACILLGSCGARGKGGAPHALAEASPARLERARSIAASLSPEEVLGQLFMVSWAGLEPPDRLYAWIREWGLGGIKIFGWNSSDDLEALASTIAALQSASRSRPDGLPLLVATDQEGGWIRHVKGSTSRTPGNMAIGASGFPQDAYDSGALIGRELAALGINMNFAPVLDLATASDSWLIGSRAFSQDPMEAGILGAAFARGLESSGVIPTAKHFPGHGATREDSHVVLPSLGLEWDRLWARELMPFRVLAAEGVPAMMTGHLAFPKVDPSGAPASLSPFFIKEILRGRMGYHGLVVTDDLVMAGATSWGGSLSRTALLALRAGNDLLLFSSLPSQSLRDSLLSELRSDPALLASCRESAARVIDLKLGLSDAVARVAVRRPVSSLVPDPDAWKTNLDLAARSVTLVRGRDLPLPRGGKGLLLVGAFDAFFQEGLRYFPEASSCRVSFQGGIERKEADAREAAAAAVKADRIVLCLANDDPEPLLRALAASGKPVFVVSVLSPAPLARLDWARTLIAAYSWSAESLNAAFAVLRGDIEASGELPLELR